VVARLIRRRSSLAVALLRLVVAPWLNRASTLRAAPCTGAELP
jgi:hypothetical protein